MTGELIELQVSAVRNACGQMTALHLKALNDSFEQACRIPAEFWWDRKAAAHAEIFNVLADTVNEPLAGRVLSSGDPEGAALEMEKHLRVLRCMGRLANCAAHRASA